VPNGLGAEFSRMAEIGYREGLRCYTWAIFANGAAMQTDPSSLDPEERTNKFLALFSIALGFLSIPAALIPICGGIAGLLGLVTGYFGLRSENRRIAYIGIALSAIGLLTALIYGPLSTLFGAH
jgi:ABC-type branched-subunit amino acid transport system permease subunit